MAAATSAPAQVETVYILRPHALIASDVVRLADIVDVTAGEGQTAKALAAVALWRAPPACQPMTATAADVEARLRSVMASSSHVARLVGAPDVRIETGCQRVDSSDMVSVAKKALDRWLLLRSERFDVAAHGVLGAIELPLGPVSLMPRQIAPGQAPTARMQVWVDVAVADRFIRTVPLVFDVHAFRGVWLAAHDLRAGQPLADATMVRHDIDVAALAVEPVRAIPDNMRLRRALSSGGALTASHMEPCPQVSQGSTVVVTSRTGAFAVQARAQALQDGRIGQPVWVRVAASTGPVLARVVDENVVELGHE